MKKFSTIALVSVFALSLVITGCKKYQEGPGITVASKKGRVSAVWNVTESYSDGVLDTCSTDCTASRAASTTEYSKDGKYTDINVWVVAGTTVLTTTTTGTWEFSQDKMSILINDDSDSPDQGYVWSSYILKLKGKEMWLGSPTEKGKDPQDYTIYMAE